MDKTYVAIVFPTYAQALYAFERLGEMNRNDELTVHGAAVVHRDAAGRYEVVNKRGLFPGARTLLTGAAGAFIGMLAGGPAGMAAGAYAGGVAGLVGDVVKSGEGLEGIDEIEPGLRENEAAIVGEITEKEPERFDERMRALSGRVYRRTAGELRQTFFADSDAATP